MTADVAGRGLGDGVVAEQGGGLGLHGRIAGATGRHLHDADRFSGAGLHAGGDAGLATGAAVEGNLEGILLADAGLGEGHEAAVVVGEVGLALVMDLGKAGDGGLELFLLGEQLVGEIPGIGRCLAFERWNALESGGHTG